LFLRLPAATVDVTAWNHWRLPDLEADALPAGVRLWPGVGHR
jgi:hypothetical protein